MLGNTDIKKASAVESCLSRSLNIRSIQTTELF
jgi:hypothetical protein